MIRTYRLAGSIVLAASLSLLSACSILPKPEQVDVYWLPYGQAPVAASRSAPVSWSLRLDKPMASGGLELSRYTASFVLLCFIVACIVLFPQRAAARAH